MPRPTVIDLGRMSYRDAYARQAAAAEALLASRGASTDPGVIFTVEHDAVITVSRRAENSGNLLASADVLARAGVTLEATDRGGDITYHGPGQVVVYPILDLQRLRLGVHAYLRMLEEAAIRACAAYGVDAGREPGATGVWVPRPGSPARKICAIGVRIRKWVSMHGLALNVRTNLDHFGLIVPCGLTGREVTSMERELGEACPDAADVRARLAEELASLAAAAAPEQASEPRT